MVTNSNDSQINQTQGVDPNTWLAWAQYYAQRGFAVLPLTGKRPLTSRGVYDASADPAQWQVWVQQFPGCNIGVAIPDGVAVVDVDPRNGGGPTFDRLDDIEHAIPRDTLEVTTGSGGLHVFVALPHGHALPSTLGPGVDVKQLGGYVVAAPSVHPDTGQHYRVTRDAPIAAAPPALAARSTPRGASRVKAIAADEIDDARRDAAGWGLDPELVVQDVTPEQITQAVEAVESIYVPGQRHHVRVKMGSVLKRLGWSAASVEAFGHALHDTYGGDNSNKIARETVRGMGYPSGYYDLLEMLPAGAQRDDLQRALDSLHNPYGAHLRESRAASANDVLARLAKIEAQQAARSGGANPVKDRFGWRAARTNGPAPLQLVAGLDITDGRTTGVAGLPHAGKTPLAMALALSIANGKDWLGHATQKRPVLYLNFEKGFDAIQKRERLASGLGVDPESLELLNMGDRGAFLNDKSDTIAKVVSIVKDVHADTGQTPLLIIDTLANSVAGVDHNVAAYAEPLRELVVAARQIAPCSVVVLLHCRKSLPANVKPTLNDIEGSGQIAGLCDAVIGLHKPDAGDGNKVTLSSVRTLTEEQPTIEIVWSGGKDEPLTCRESGAEDRFPKREGEKKKTAVQIADEVTERLINVIEAAPEGFSWDREVLKTAARCSSHKQVYKDAWKEAIKHAVERRLIDPWGGTRGTPEGYRKLTRQQLAAKNAQLQATAQIFARNADMIADAAVGPSPLPIGSPGHAPSPVVGGFFGPTPGSPTLTLVKPNL